MKRLTWSGIALHGGPLPGYPASHGCVRMPYDFARNLFDATRLGMRVIVVPADVAPVEIAHPALFQPMKSDTDFVAAARNAEAQEAADKADQARLVHPSGIEGLIFGSWATLSGERLSCVGPAEGPGHGGVEISDELLDPGLQHLLAGEVAAADKLSYQNGKPDFDLIEP